MSQLTPSDIARIHAEASDVCGDELELDDLDKYLADEPLASRFSVGDDGVWIQAWIWVPAKEEA